MIASVVWFLTSADEPAARRFYIVSTRYPESGSAEVLLSDGAVRLRLHEERNQALSSKNMLYVTCETDPALTGGEPRLLWRKAYPVDSKTWPATRIVQSIMRAIQEVKPQQR